MTTTEYKSIELRGIGGTVAKELHRRKGRIAGLTGCEVLYGSDVRVIRSTYTGPAGELLLTTISLSDYKRWLKRVGRPWRTIAELMVRASFKTERIGYTPDECILVGPWPVKDLSQMDLEREGKVN